MDETKLRVKEVELKGLFGLYDHHFSLNLDDRVTLIHGPNGVGKTVLLKLLAAFFAGRIVELSRTDFTKFEVTLSDGSIVGVTKTRVNFSPEAFDSLDNAQQILFGRVNVPEQRPDFHRIVAKAYVIKDGKLAEAELGALPNRSSSVKLAELIDRESTFLYRVGADQWLDRQNREYLSSSEVVERYYDRLPERYQVKLFKEPEILRDLRRRVKVHFIETQRLLKLKVLDNETWRHDVERSSVVSMVKSYAGELKEKISSTLTNYSKVSQSLDQTFPWRLLHGPNQAVFEEELKTKMVALDERRNYLKQIGLVANDLGAVYDSKHGQKRQDDQSYPFDVAAIDALDATRLEVLALHVADTEQKLSALDSLAERASLLLGIVNKKFRNKTISLDKQDGLRAVSSTGAHLDLDALSSGEQHELVLIYDLLFKVERDTLVLLDEPELSLHLSWQKQFLSDLLSIVEASSFDVIVATHSPFIVDARYDLMVPLGGKQEEETQHD